jgi:hypothetical protein
MRAGARIVFITPIPLSEYPGIHPRRGRPAAHPNPQLGNGGRHLAPLSGGRRNIGVPAANGALTRSGACEGSSCSGGFPSPTEGTSATGYRPSPIRRRTA